MRRSGRFLLLSTLPVVAGGCVSPNRGPALGEAIAARASIRDRSQRQLIAADFYKPRQNSDADFGIEMTPLIVQELAGDTTSGTHPDRFGTIRWDGDGRVRVDTGTPAVYFAKSTAILRQNTYEQITFAWFYPQSVAPNALAAQGVRMTLDTEGFPLVWEVLADTTAKTLVFVTESLEAGAVKRFGTVRHGRRYAVEPSVSNLPDVVLPRLIADGPMPMGPWVYLRAATRDVTTLLCRCSPSEVDELVEAPYYDLLPLESLADLGLDVSHWQSPTAFAFDGSDDPRRLEHTLRLPDIE